MFSVCVGGRRGVCLVCVWGGGVEGWGGGSRGVCVGGSRGVCVVCVCVGGGVQVCVCWGGV